LRFSLALAGVALMSAACASIIGIEDAEKDPLLNGGGNAAGGSAPTTLCGQYCAALTANCTDDFQQYFSETVCLDVCAALPLGEEANPVGNTIACRHINAGQAADIGPQTECSAAGPGSDGVCGDNCDSYCLLFEANCEERFLAAHGNQPTCRSFCDDNIPDLFELDGTVFSAALTTMGDNLQCRLYHVSQATIDKNTHCPHADGESVCSDGTGGGGGMGGAGGAGGVGGN
jgi:hypothetical protein